MKKKIFLSGVNAKLALAAVALTSVMFTSCEKEEFNVAPVELDPASATVAITVYDLSDGSSNYQKVLIIRVYHKKNKIKSK